VTLGIDTTKVPLLNAVNTFTGNQTVNGNLTATGVVTGSAFQIGSNLFAYGSYANLNAMLGFAGNSTMTGGANTASGFQALSSNTSGYSNTASGAYALSSNLTGVFNTATGAWALNHNTGDASGNGSFNTASGFEALSYNTLGNSNTASGYGALFSNTGDSSGNGTGNTATGFEALYSNTTGNNNTAVGVNALLFNYTGNSNTGVGTLAGFPKDTSNVVGSNNTFLGFNSAMSTGTLNNANAIGANAEVSESNAMVLGSINGVNNATADTNVGIGTTAPQTLFHIDHAPPVGVGMDVAEITSGGGIDVASLLLKNTGPGGLRLRVGAGTGSGYLASSGSMAFITGDTGSPSFPTGPTMTIDASGNVNIAGNLSKHGGSFKIDHPLDPANKYLYHSFVESPDMMNVYNGNITTNKRGLATVTLPDYFEALNQDFRYQLTVIGQFAQAIVARKIAHNQFVIRTNRSHVEVSWQVTGVRHDAWANAHRIPVEEDKPLQERGKYFHPEF
jgi:hypothetical protein